MKIARFADVSNQLASGIIQDEQVELIHGDIFCNWKPSAIKLGIAQVQLLSPVNPRNIPCLGKNFHSSSGEENSKAPKVPLLFIKSIPSLIDAGQDVILPSLAPGEVYFEAELAIVIGRRTCNVAKMEATKFIFGYTIANEVGAKDCQAFDGQWAPAKSFDIFCSLDPWIETEFDSGNCWICSRMNGVLIQDSATSHMIFNVAQAVSFISCCMTLLPGTVTYMRSAGVLTEPRPLLNAENGVEIEIVGVGVLSNPIITKP